MEILHPPGGLLFIDESSLILSAYYVCIYIHIYI